jgi:hypothetical protein
MKLLKMNPQPLNQPLKLKTEFTGVEGRSTAGIAYDIIGMIF